MKQTRLLDRRHALRRIVSGVSGGAVSASAASLGIGSLGAGALQYIACGAEPSAARAAAASSVPAASGSARAKVVVSLGEKLGTIKPAIYSHFAEHIGGVIYDGIWVGRDSKIANLGGIRQAIVEHVRRLGPVVLRWPGGCFADGYHWRDGVGPADKRPRRFGRWREETEPNHFGTHELVRFCRLAGVEPYFAANVGTGTAQEFQEWIEYCNAPAGKTTLADERAAHGDRDPLGVRYWGVGNESWGCGGKFTPEDYCTEYRRFTDWLPTYNQPLFLIAAGPNGNDVQWTRRFLKKWTDYARAPLSGWAAHYYAGTTGHALEFSLDQWYEMLLKSNQMERLIHDQWAAMGEFDPDHKIKLIVDEWGNWHPEGTEINRRHLYEQMGCLRDALSAALTLDVFNRHAAKLEMTNIAQLVNNLHSLFLADGDQFVATPTFHVFEMYKPHQAAEAVRLDSEANEIEFRAGGAGGTAAKLFRVAGSASVAGQRLTVTLVNAHASEPAEVALELRGGSARAVRGTTLVGASLNAHNTFADPGRVTPRPANVANAGASPRLILAPASVSRFDIDLG